MIKRENKSSELAIKKGIKLSKIYSLTAVRKVLQKDNLPNHVIDRVLNEPLNIRSTDTLD